MIFRSTARGAIRTLLGYTIILVSCLPQFAALAQSTKDAKTQPLASQAVTREAWRGMMLRIPKPKKGCFKATFPKLEWEEVPCTTAPPNPQQPANWPPPDIVGGGNDYSAQVAGLITSATGSFQSGTSVTTETGTTYSPNPACSSPVSNVPNVFALQLNTQTFQNSSNNVPACSGAANPKKCSGWQQFVWSNAGSGSAYMQYWLLGYGPACPAGWAQTGGNCYINSPATNPPVQTIGNLRQLSLQAEANADGTDSITVSWGSGTLAASNQDSVLNLSQNWNAAEFNVFGDHCGSEAVFGSKTTIVVKTSVNYGSATPPTNGGGFTGEKNNLTLAPFCPFGGDATAIEFTESNVSGATSVCSCSANQAWLPNAGACGPAAPTCRMSGCNSDINWQYSMTCKGMDVGIVYNGGCTDRTGEPENCYAGFDGSSTASVSWNGYAGSPTWFTPANQGNPQVCTIGFGQQNCRTFTFSGLPACPSAVSPASEGGGTPGVPICPNGERYCTKFSPPQCVLDNFCLLQKAH